MKMGMLDSSDSDSGFNQVSGFALRGAGCELRVTRCGIQVARCALRGADLIRTRPRRRP